MQEKGVKNETKSILEGIHCALAILVTFVLISPISSGHVEEAEELFEGAEKTIVVFDEDPAIVADGLIGENEYSELGHWEDEDTGLEAYLAHDGKNIYVAIDSPGKGWVGIALANGLEEGANVVMAFLEDNVLFAEDGYAFNVSDEMEHQADTLLNGTYDILAINASQDSSGTILEFTLPLNSTDPYDQQFEPGFLYPVVIAFNETAREFSPTLDEGKEHFLLLYVTRQKDDPLEIKDLFMQKISPLPAIGAMAFLVVSIGLLFVAYGLPKRRIR